MPIGRRWKRREIVSLRLFLAGECQLPAPTPRRGTGAMARLVERDGWRCHWCGFTCNPALATNDPLFPTRDHVVRLADGGGNGLSNLVVACRKCNGSRHAANWPEKLEMLRKTRRAMGLV